MTKHRTVWGLVAGIAVVALVVGGLAVASNMGFKFVPNIPSNGAFNLSLPWNNNYSNAQSLLTDLRSGGDVTRVAKFNANSTLTSWDGESGVNFAIEKARSYIAYGGTNGATPVIVGSHDPNFTIDIGGNQAFNAAAPYHQTFSNAQALLTDLRDKGGDVTRVAKFNTNSTLTSWDGESGVNFSLDLGMGVVIYTGGGGVNGYVWPHY